MNVSAIIVTRGNVDLNPILLNLPKEWPTFVWDNGMKRVRMRNGRDLSSEYFDDVEDLSVYGRYAAIEYTNTDLIYVQDDDCIVSDPQAIVSQWQAAGVKRAAHEGHLEHVVCNMPYEFRYGFYEEHALVGFGAVFHRDAPQRAFDLFERGCGVTTYLAEEPEFKRERQGKYIVQSNSPHRKYDVGRGWLTVADFQRTCDVVFTALTPRVLVNIPYANLPWATDENRMYRQPEHMAERGKMLELAFRAKDANI